MAPYLIIHRMPPKKKPSPPHAAQDLWEQFGTMPVYGATVGFLARRGEALPNVLLYGPDIRMMDAIWKEGLRQRFGSVGHWQERTIRHIVFRECPCAFDIDLANPNHPKEALTDREMLSDLIKDLIATPPVYAMDATAVDRRHIVVLRNLDRIVHPHVFRVLLERFSHNVWFLATTTSLSRIESPLRSRFMMVRVPAPPPSQGPVATPPSVPTAGCLIEGLWAEGTKPGIAEIRACAHALVGQNIPLRDLGTALLARFPKKRHALCGILADIEWHFARTTRGREPIYHELLLHEAIYGEAT